MKRRGRGQWQRGQTGEERRAAQRSAILEAAAQQAVQDPRGPSVDDILEWASVGRNTFYALFPDADAAVAAARELAGRAFDRALAEAVVGAYTPRDRLRRVAAAWVAAAGTGGALATALFLVPEVGIGPLDATRFALERALSSILRDAKVAGAIGGFPDELRMHLVAGAFEAGARLVAAGHQDERKIAETLADTALRAFR